MKGGIATIGTWSHDIVSGSVRFCGVTASLFGFGPGEDLSDVSLDRIIEVIHPKDRNLFVEAVVTASLQGGPFFAEYRLITASGEFRRVLDRGEFYKNASGIVDRAKGIVVDLTHYAPATLKAKAAKARRKGSFAKLPDMADHLLSAWKLGQQLPPEVFETLKPPFQNLLYELGLRIAEAETGCPVRASKKSGLH